MFRLSSDFLAFRRVCQMKDASFRFHGRRQGRIRHPDAPARHPRLHGVSVPVDTDSRLRNPMLILFANMSVWMKDLCFKFHGTCLARMRHPDGTSLVSLQSGLDIGSVRMWIRLRVSLASSVVLLTGVMCGSTIGDRCPCPSREWHVAPEECVSGDPIRVESVRACVRPSACWRVRRVLEGRGARYRPIDDA